MLGPDLGMDDLPQGGAAIRLHARLHEPAVGKRIREEFGGHVAGIVIACSDTVAVPGQPKPPWRERKTAYIERLAAEENPEALLVSACDKLHNTRAIVADLRQIGHAVWKRFSQPDPAAQLWYYESLDTCYSGRVPTALAAEIGSVTAELRSLAIATA